MIHVTIFSGYDGRLQNDTWLYLTLFGGCDLTRPTLARRLLEQREAGQPGPPPRRRPLLVTLFAGVDIKSPTLAEEFIDLREMINAGLLTMDDWDRSMATLGRADPDLVTLTLFGGVDESALPSEDDEIEALAVQRHLGNIPASASHVLQYGIGRGGAERSSTVRRAILAST